MKGVIGEAVTIQKLYLNASNTPVNVVSPTIQIYYWNALGNKQVLLITTAFPASSPAETGRYAYTYTIPNGLTPEYVLYALLQATDPDTEDALVDEIQIDLTDPGVAPCPGLIAQFVRGG